MKSRFTLPIALLGFLAVLAVMVIGGPGGGTQDARAASSSIVINRVYPGGGESNAAEYRHDYIELVNRGGGAQSLNGWSLQIWTSGTSWTVISLNNVSVPANGYYLIGLGGGSFNTRPVLSPVPSW